MGIQLVAKDELLILNSIGYLTTLDTTTVNWYVSRVETTARMEAERDRDASDGASRANVSNLRQRRAPSSK